MALVELGHRGAIAGGHLGYQLGIERGVVGRIRHAERPYHVFVVTWLRAPTHGRCHETG